MKNMQAYFHDVTRLVNIMQTMTSREEQYAALVQKCSVSEQLNSAAIFEAIEQLFSMKGDNAGKLESLLSQLHYSQLINFDYKFSISTSDSMIGQNGKCLVNLKLDLLNEQNQRDSVYLELSLNQFYTFFHELKRAYTLMN